MGRGDGASHEAFVVEPELGAPKRSRDLNPHLQVSESWMDEAAGDDVDLQVLSVLLQGAELSPSSSQEQDSPLNWEIPFSPGR